MVKTQTDPAVSAGVPSFHTSLAIGVGPPYASPVPEGPRRTNPEGEGFVPRVLLALGLTLPQRSSFSNNCPTQSSLCFWVFCLQSVVADLKDLIDSRVCLPESEEMKISPWRWFPPSCLSFAPVLPNHSATSSPWEENLKIFFSLPILFRPFGLLFA